MSISVKKLKKQTLEKGFALIGKRYHNNFKPKNLSDIVEIATSIVW